VDISSATGEAAFRCLKTNGFDFAVIRAWQSTGRADPACAGSAAAAWAGGLAHVDVYMFPCYSCGDPAGQVQRMVASLRANNVKYGMLWFDIEGPGTYWSGNTAANANFFKAMADEARSLGEVAGVYTSESQWIPIMGGYTGGSSFPLWYAHYDNTPSFSDFRAFGGWSKPAIKQYAGDATVCGVGIDKDWYP